MPFNVEESLRTHECVKEDSVANKSIVQQKTIYNMSQERRLGVLAMSFSNIIVLCSALVLFTFNLEQLLQVGRYTLFQTLVRHHFFPPR